MCSTVGLQTVAVIFTFYSIENICLAKILRNNALMTKMVSDFQKDNNILSEPHRSNEHVRKSEKLLSVMQNVLCRNFPTIPCKMIMQDVMLRKLIEKSIQQINYKQLMLDKTTPMPGYHLTLFPIVNSEDLSNFLQVRDTGYFDNQEHEVEPLTNIKKQKQKKNVIMKSTKNVWSQEKRSKNRKKNKNKKETQRTMNYTGRKKIRKFYPHKIKYKDKKDKNTRKEFGDYTEEKLSMSVEVPDMTLASKHQHLTYKVEPAEPPVWRIDYMKHGEPSLNMFDYENNQLKGKIMKPGPSVIVDENVLEHIARKDVLHPDVYIKKNMNRKNPLDLNSDGLE